MNHHTSPFLTPPPAGDAQSCFRSCRVRKRKATETWYTASTPRVNHSTPHETQELHSPSETALLLRPNYLQRNLHNRPSIRLPRRNHIIQRTHPRNRQSDQNRPIHRRRRHLLIRRPKAKKEHKQQIHTSERVIRNPKYPRDFPRAPHSVGVGAVGGLGGVRGERGVGGRDSAGAAPVEQQAGGEEVGGEEAGDGDGDYAVEGGGGAEVDEGEEGGDDAGEGDGVDRDGGSWAELWER